jgi:glycerol-3-phosphate acyltransferase PlsY
LRALGPVPALVSGLLDTAKGAVTVLIAMSLGVGPTIEVLAALASIIGHSRSPYIGFNGGRGVAPAWGALLVFQPVIALGVVPMFLAVVAITRISSLASLTTSLVAAVALLAAVVLLAMPTAYAGYAVGAAAIVWLFHADNIRRLITGEERRIEWPRSRGG